MAQIGQDETSIIKYKKSFTTKVGQVKFQIDLLGHALHFEYDEQGRTVRQTDANGSVTIFSYNDEGKLWSLTDPVGNTTRYEYDANGNRKNFVIGKTVG
jgi:YD repeat-containing protein